MSDFLISVIIPCYNVAPYIDRCLNSIFNQTIGAEKIEIILVNDASTDNTLEKLQSWEAAHPDNVLVITYDTNMRQGTARNIGLQYSTAPYVGFIDSDDWIDPQMYEDLYSHMATGKYDVVRCKYQRDDADPYTAPLYNSDFYQEDHVFNFECINGFYWGEPDSEQTGVNGKYGPAVTGLYKKQQLIENNILFPEKLAYEDNYWVAALKLFVSSMYIIDRPYYHYYVNRNSTICSRNSMHHLDRIITEKMILDHYKNCGAFDIFYDYLLTDFIRKFYLNTLYLIITRFDDSPNLYDSLRDSVYNYFPDWASKYPIADEPSFNQLLLLYLRDVPSLSDEDFVTMTDQYIKLLSEYTNQ